MQEPVVAGVPVRAGQEGWGAGQQPGAQGRGPSPGGLISRRVLPGMGGGEVGFCTGVDTEGSSGGDICQFYPRVTGPLSPYKNLHPCSRAPGSFWISHVETHAGE